MRSYESIFIVHPEIVGDELNDVAEKFKQILVEQGAEFYKLDNWGIRTMAYPVKKQTQGCYVLMLFEADPAVIKEYERRLRIDDKILKFQTVMVESGFDSAPEPADVKESESAEENEA